MGCKYGNTTQSGCNALDIEMSSLVNHSHAFVFLQYHKSKEGSTAKAEAGLDLTRAVSHRMHIDKSVELVGKLLFGVDAGPTMLAAVRPRGLPLVDDWSCLKSMVSRVTFWMEISYS